MVNAYWALPSTIGKVVEVAELLAYVSLGFFAAEFIRTFSFDLSIITGKRHRRWPQLVYFGTKYVWITYFVTNLIVIFSSNSLNCQALMDATEFQMGIVVCLSSFLLACRTVCVYQGRTRTVITTLLCVLGLGLIAAWMQGVQDVRSTWSTAASSPWTSGACIYNSVKSTYWVKYIVTIAFDLAVLVLTTVGILRMEGKSRIGDILIKHGLIYFILTFIANMVIAILTALQLSPTMSLATAIPQSTVCVISSTRLYMTLATEARPETTYAPTDFTSTQHSTSSRISSFLKNGSSRNNGAIPFTPSATPSADFACNRVLSHNDSNCSKDDLEKAMKMSSSGNNHGPMIRVEQSRIVQVEQLPAHLVPRLSFRGSAILDDTLMPALYEDEHTSTPAEVALQYPRLSRGPDRLQRG